MKEIFLTQGKVARVSDTDYKWAYLASFKTFEEAVQARKQAEQELFGDFASRGL